MNVICRDRLRHNERQVRFRLVLFDLPLAMVPAFDKVPRYITRRIARNLCGNVVPRSAPSGATLARLLPVCRRVVVEKIIAREEMGSEVVPEGILSVEFVPTDAKINLHEKL